MHIQINPDKHISGNAAMAENVEEILGRGLSRFASQITRLEVHLSDENSAAKSGANDKRCMLEARAADRKPTTVSELAVTTEQALTGAAHQMVSLLVSELGKH